MSDDVIYFGFWCLGFGFGSVFWSIFVYLLFKKD